MGHLGSSKWETVSKAKWTFLWENGNPASPKALLERTVGQRGEAVLPIPIWVFFFSWWGMSKLFENSL